MTLEVTAPAMGVIKDISIAQGDKVLSEQAVMLLNESVVTEQNQKLQIQNDSSIKPDEKGVGHNKHPNRQGANINTIGLLFGIVALAIAALFFLN